MTGHVAHPSAGTMGLQALAPVYITDTLLAETGRLVATFAETRPSEGIVYWFGIEAGALSVVTTVVVPDADTSTGAVRTSVLANAQAQTVAVDTPLVLLGQAHSHPGHYVDHSPVDDEETFARFDGAISLVIPYFARYGVHLPDCGVHRHLDGEFRRIRGREVDRHLVPMPGGADFRRVPDDAHGRRP